MEQPTWTMVGDHLADPRPSTRNRLGLNGQWKASQDSNIEMVLYYDLKHHVRRAFEKLKKEYKEYMDTVSHGIHEFGSDHISHLLKQTTLHQQLAVVEEIYNYIDAEEQDCKRWKKEQEELIFEIFGNRKFGIGVGTCRICLEPKDNSEIPTPWLPFEREKPNQD